MRDCYEKARLEMTATRGKGAVLIWTGMPVGKMGKQKHGNCQL